MHEGFRPPDDDTCSMCPNDLPDGKQVLCKTCRERAAEIIAESLGSQYRETVFIVNPDNSWGVGNMRLNLQRGTR
jgi:hypothetical protein